MWIWKLMFAQCYIYHWIKSINKERDHVAKYLLYNLFLLLSYGFIDIPVSILNPFHIHIIYFLLKRLMNFYMDKKQKWILTG